MNLNKYLANKFLAYHEGKQLILCVIYGDFIISNSEAVLSETDINQCSSEDADLRIVHHVINLGKKGYTNVRVKKVDSDGVILYLPHVDIAMSNGIESFLIVCGPKGKKIDIIDNFNKFSVRVCKGLAFFHAFIGCNTVSSFYKIEKAKFWTVSLAKVKAGDTALSNIFKKFSDSPRTKQAPFKTRRTDNLISTPNIKFHLHLESFSIKTNMYPGWLLSGAP